MTERQPPPPEDEIHPKVLEWTRKHHPERLSADKAERLTTACFNAGHFPNPVGHSVVGCEICEALIAFRAADPPAETDDPPTS